MPSNICALKIFCYSRKRRAGGYQSNEISAAFRMSDQPSPHEGYSEEWLPTDTDTPTNRRSMPFSDSLEQIFSILPEQQALSARQTALQNYIKADSGFGAEIAWADFTESGRFKGGGVADIAGSSIRVAKNTSDQPEIERLAEIAKDGGCKAGQIEYCVAENSIVWFLPNLTKSFEGVPEPSLRGLLIPEAIVHEILEMFNSGAQLTTAEKHLVFQLSAGLSLRIAAEVDCLAFETKRAQLKTACSKLQCSGQTDLLRQVLGQMTYLLRLCDIEGDRSAEIEQFSHQYLAPDTRIVVQRLSNGRSIRILERGPADGKPILVIHGMLWPLLFLGNADILKRKHIRFIVPLRAGYLDRQTGEDIYGKDDMVALSLEDIARYQRECFGSALPVIGNSYGGVLAIEYARLFPDLVSALFVVAITSVEPTSVNRGFVGRLFWGLQSLSNRPGIFRYLAWQFRKYYADEKTVIPILKKMYAGSNSDLALIDGQSETSAIYPWFVKLYQKSIPGIADDFKFVLGNPREILKGIKSDIVFVHGTEDPMVEIQIVEGYAAIAENALFETIDGAGHHLFNTHTDQLWEIIQGHCEALDH